MATDKRLQNALAISLAINAVCVALIGRSELAHAARAVAPPRAVAASLRPVKIDLAQAIKPSTPDDSPSSDGDPGSSHGEAGRPAATHPKTTGSDRSADNSKTDENSKADEHAQEQRSNEPQIKPRGIREAVKRTPIAHRERIAARANAHGLLARRKTDEQPHGAPSANGPRGAGNQLAQAKKGNAAANGAPSEPSGLPSGHSVHWADSVSPHSRKYPKMALNLGTIHERRPTHGITGGGNADLRNVDITAHYVVDDPNNKPKTLQPDRNLHRFKTVADPDPGNKSKCIATGGNTRLGGTVLHGHDNITGVKYCVPGGGMPGMGGGSGNSHGALKPADFPHPYAGRDRHTGLSPGIGAYVGAAYHGSATERGLDESRVALDPGTELSTNRNPLHLPDRHSDINGQTPGARVPLVDRRWVYDPLDAHESAAPPGPQTPAFTIAPHDVGSLSRSGVVDWGKPHPAPKKPFGGDGSGLLGMYYLGNNFNTLMFTRPDHNIDYIWTGTGPSPLMPRHAFSVRWLGDLTPRYTETYTLFTASDDGVRLYLDDKLIICNWTVHGVTEDTATVALQAGHKYRLKLEYYEKNGESGEIVKLYWQSPHQPLEYVPEQCLSYPLPAAQGA